MPQKTLTLDEALDSLKSEGALPERLRFCEGTLLAESGKSVSKRLFSGPNEIWLDPDSSSEQIMGTLEGLGYECVGKQAVPDGFGHNFDSSYYARSGHEAPRS